MKPDGSNLHPLLPGWKAHAALCCGDWTHDGRYLVQSPAGSLDLWALRDAWQPFHRKAEPVQLTRTLASLLLAKNPSSLVETLKITLEGVGGDKGKLLIEWENVTASAPFTVKWRFPALRLRSSTLE